MTDLLTPLGVQCVDGREIQKIFPSRILNGWEIKPYSIIHCPFERVLLLDSDCIPVVNPEFLLSTPQFRETGAIFWPDFGTLAHDRRIWEACDIPYKSEPEFESGQIVMDKERCWRELQITMHLNEYSDFYYHLIHGDKETFHMAFRKTGKAYSMPDRGIEALEATMCQHDFDGARIFQHRNMDKWSLCRDNLQVADFWHEDLCFGFLKELREQWGANVAQKLYFDSSRVDEAIKPVVAELLSAFYRYTRVGFDSRVMSFLENGKIGLGRAQFETFWNVRQIGDDFVLSISGTERVTCKLRRIDDAWFGEWIEHERMTVELRRLSVAGGASCLQSFHRVKSNGNI
jgi:hypothetical protein